MENILNKREMNEVIDFAGRISSANGSELEAGNLTPTFDISADYFINTAKVVDYPYDYSDKKELKELYEDMKSYANLDIKEDIEEVIRTEEVDSHLTNFIETFVILHDKLTGYRITLADAAKKMGITDLYLKYNKFH